MRTQTTSRMLLFSAVDYRIIKGAIALAGVAAPVLAFCVPVVRGLLGHPLQQVVWLNEPAAQAAAGSVVPVTGHAVLPGAPLGTWLMALLPGVVLSVTCVLLAWLLYGLVSAVQRGQCFVQANVARIHGIAMVLLIGGLTHPVAVMLAESAVALVLWPEQGWRAHLSVGLVPLALLGLSFIVMVIGEAFRRGIELQDDVEGLI